MNEQLIEDIQKALEQFEASDAAEEILINVRVIHVHSVLWLRALLEENKRMAEGWVIAESLSKQISELHEELSAKDKVLEWYADMKNHYIGYNETEQKPFAAIDDDNGEQARAILFQYKGDPKNETL